MNEADAIDLLQMAIWTVIVACGPCVAVAMAIGLFIALLQALTQVQEVTLTFVPKIMGIFAAAILFAYQIGASIASLTTLTMSRIETGF